MKRAGEHNIYSKMIREKGSAMKALACGAIAAALLAGCITSSYPKNWPNTVPAAASECTDLTGSYENFGFWGDGERIVLASLFFPLSSNEPLINNYERKAVTHITFAYRGDNDLVVKAWVNNQLLMERLLTASELSCREGRNVYHETAWALDGVPPFLPVFHHTDTDRLLSLASDGSLVMENHDVSKGVAIVIPFLVKANYWFRFPRTSHDSSGQINDGNRPQGVRTGTTPAYRLLPPEGSSKWSGYKDASDCLEQAAKSEETPDPQALALLGGRSTQAFILQDGKDGALSQHGSIIGNNWIPTTHELRVEKQHWQSQSVTDRYVICLIAKGYRWDAPVIEPLIQDFREP